MAFGIPAVTTSVKDQALGVLPPDSSASVFVIGVSSSGTANAITSYTGAETQSLKDTYGTGPLVDAAAHILLHSKGRATVHVVRGSASTAGSDSAVTASGGGPTVSLTGTPYDDYSVVVTIVQGGAVGTSTFKYSLDGGTTQSGEIATAATYALPSGTTLNFASGTYVAAETYSFTSTGPKNTNTDLGTALDAVIASSKVGSLVYIVGFAANAADTETIATTLGSKLATAMASHRYMRGIVECPPIDKSGLITGFADFESARVSVCLGFGNLVNVNTTRTDKRGIARAVVARLVRNGLSIDPSRNDTDSDLEPLDGLSVPDNQAASTAYHLENQSSGGDAARFTTVMKHNGRGGVYTTNCRLMAGPTSDFQLIQYGRIIDKACDIAYAAMLRYLSARLRIDGETGYIQETQARAIEADVRAKLVAGLVADGHASDADVAVNRGDNLLSDATLRVKVRVVPPGYAKAITVEVGFRNPALALQAA
jgi:hypothetical protein